mmetsp:Transcript_19980/g.57857  ORF Transcript_19980/g.57857 Transcript_19980/m.57857 type:complete len:232 (+) Transcript_19980:2845-3540(+)
MAALLTGNLPHMSHISPRPSRQSTFRSIPSAGWQGDDARMIGQNLRRPHLREGRCLRRCCRRSIHRRWGHHCRLLRPRSGNPAAASLRPATLRLPSPAVPQASTRVSPSGSTSLSSPSGPRHLRRLLARLRGTLVRSTLVRYPRPRSSPGRNSSLPQRAWRPAWTCPGGGQRRTWPRALPRGRALRGSHQRRRPLPRASLPAANDLGGPAYLSAFFLFLRQRSDQALKMPR